jgi:hypothetical protein
MSSGRVIWLTMALCLAALLVLPLERALGQCGGYCQSSQTCPASGYGCDGGTCCYCCDSCEQAVCGGVIVGYTLSGQPIYNPTYYWHDLWYNCYQGSNCTYSGTEDQQQCDGNCQSSGNGGST